MERRGQALIAGVLATACGPGVSSEIELAEICGEHGPVQILALGDEEAVGPSEAVARFGDRWLYAVERFDRPVVDLMEASLWGEYRTIPQLDARVESIDRCGGDRRVVAEGIDVILPPKAGGEPWLGYRRDTQMLFVFDPQGRFEAQPLARPRHYLWHIVDERGVILHRDDERDLVRFTIDGEAARLEVLATNVASTATMSLYWQEAPSSLLVLHDDGDLVEVALDSGDTELVLRGVRSFSHDRDRRFVAWAPGDPATPRDELPTEVMLLDRATGEQRALGSGDPMFFQIVGSHVMLESYVGEEPLHTTSTTFTSLPGYETVKFEGRRQYFGSGAARQLVVKDGDPPAPQRGASVYAPVEGELRLVAGPVPASTNTGDALWHRDPAPYTELDGGTDYVPYDLVRFSLADFRAETAQHRIWSGIELPGARWADVRVDPHQTIGELVILDGADGTAGVLDHDVAPTLTAHDPIDRTDPHPWATDEFVYQVRAPGSDRTGLWRVRIADE